MTINITLPSMNGNRVSGESLAREALRDEPRTDEAVIYARAAALATWTFVDGLVSVLVAAGVTKIRMFGAGEKLVELMEWQAENSESPFIFSREYATPERFRDWLPRSRR
ncbi:hypothetical protein D9V32_09660 [Mycetocola tolaasinivorans]|uniref:STAS/SEC14 domain-containing protein n=1 Tax=Mycetocola tolaasinivorans TaxID=76635 RepID=A0A3L7A7A1_9MICO|nr:hypothetical protein [Mycetocola tolaasinivorans]RLP75720.1 hypothetical protein D9V32_09660 [Mycetocola tolaasinivorans]